MKGGFHPETAQFDFEIQESKMFKKHFPDCKCEGCFFHLGQSLVRKVCSTELGLKKLYQTDKEFAHAIRRFAALSFLPASDIEDGFLDITECKDECDEESCTTS